MVEVRALGPDEWETTRDIRLAGLVDSPDAFGGSYAETAQRSQDEWRSWPNDGQAFGAFVDGEPVGMACSWQRPERKDVTKLIGMWVSPEARGKGLAGKLIDAVAQWAGAHGSEAVELTVYDYNTVARDSYLKNGFVAVQQKDYEGKPCTVMRREID